MGEKEGEGEKEMARRAHRFKNVKDIVITVCGFLKSRYKKINNEKNAWDN